MPTATFEAVATNRTSALPTIDITFSESINPATLSRNAFTLVRTNDNPAVNLIDTNVTLTNISATVYRLLNLGAANATAGSYQLRLGVTNVGDSGYQSGLAFAGITINNAPIGSVPEPGTWALMILGFGAVGQALRSRRRDAQRSARLA